MAKYGKRIAAARASYDREALHAVNDAVSAVKANATAKFDETIEMSINLGVDTRHADQMVRGVCNLPSGTGKALRVAVFAKDAKADEARAAGADIVGSDDLVEQIQAGEMAFDRVIATPDMMPLVGRVARILGPKGMMPNPKVGTVTMDVTKAIGDAKGGAVEFRADKFGIIHAGVGKASFSQDALEANVNALLTAILKARPTGAKGVFLKRVTLSSTMGPGVKLDAASIAAG